MEPLSNRSKIVRKREMTFAERAYLPAIAQGLGITLKHFFKKKATINYPEQTRERSDIWRGLHVLKRDEKGAERCTACGLCAVACPAEAITMTAGERKAGEEHLYREEKYAVTYEVNMLRCIFCGYCEEACPKDAIYLSETLMPSSYKRKEFIYKKKTCLFLILKSKKPNNSYGDPGSFILVPYSYGPGLCTGCDTQS